MINNLTDTGKTTFAVTSVIFGTLANALGGFDTSLRLLVVLIVADYITGVALAIKDKKLSSEVGFIGLFKKIMIFVMVWVGFELDKALGTEVLRNIVIYFYASNEGVSLLENTGRLGVPYPEKLKKVIEQLKDRGDKNE